MMGLDIAAVRDHHLASTLEVMGACMRGER